MICYVRLLVLGDMALVNCVAKLPIVVSLGGLKMKCSSCGASVSANSMTCNNCRKEIAIDKHERRLRMPSSSSRAIAFWVIIGILVFAIIRGAGLPSILAPNEWLFWIGLLIAVLLSLAVIRQLRQSNKQ